MRHDEHSIKSVRAKIAMFSSSNGGSGGGGGGESKQASHRQTASVPLTRSLTQGDVRFDDVPDAVGTVSASSHAKAGHPKSWTRNGSVVAASIDKKSYSQADLTGGKQAVTRVSSTEGRSSVAAASSAANALKNRPPFGASRSQSLLEITSNGSEAVTASSSKAGGTPKHPISDRSQSSSALLASSSKTLSSTRRSQVGMQLYWNCLCCNRILQIRTGFE